MYGYEILHEDIAENLIRNVRENHVQHAYIFEGEEGVGALAAAQLFAAALTCEKREFAPCGLCGACVHALANTHPDIIFTVPESGKKSVTVDQIRRVTADAYTRPFESGRKVYIINGDMNEQAQNAFLKVLEEPPGYAVFILLTENHQTLLQTIRSRCMLVHFAPVSTEKVREYLKKHYPDETEPEFLAKYSGGVVGNAEKLIKREDFRELRNTGFDKLSELLSSNLLSAYSIADFLEEHKDDTELIFELWLDFIRDIILIQNDARRIITNTDLEDRMINASGRIDEKRMINAAEAIITAQKMKKRYVNLRSLALRLAFKIKKEA